jgi:hypothetical protein
MRKLLLIAAIALLVGSAAAVAAGSGPQRDARRLPSSRASNHKVQVQPPPGTCRARGTGELALPDRSCTPGAISPAVKQANIQRTICHSGYSQSVRPPESITRREKLASMAAYGDTDSSRNYEYDHLVSLELGGATNAAKNLWPEPGASPNVKDRLEDRLHKLVCDGSVTLSSAQSQVARDWRSAYRRYLGPIPSR